MIPLSYMGRIQDKKKRNALFNEWVELYSDSLYSWAFHKTSDKNQAEDLVQDTFLAAWQSYDNFKHKSQPKTWLFSILNHKIIDFYKKNSRDPLNIEADFQIDIQEIYNRNFKSDGRWSVENRPSEWGEQDHLLDNKEFKKILEHCMKELPSDWYSAMTQKYLEQKKGKKISQELGITSSNYWQIIHRAKLFLRECLEKLWFNK